MNSLKRFVLVACLFLAGSHSAWADGNLTVVLFDGTLYVVGDQERNGVVVSEHFGQVMVSSYIDGLYDQLFPYMSHSTNSALLDYSSDINHGDGPAFFDASLVSDVVIITGREHDRIIVQGVFTAGLTINSGAGDDDVLSSFDLFLSAPRLDVNSGLGNDTVAIEQFTTPGSLGVSTGNGADNIYVFGTTVGGDLQIDTGNQDDYLTLIAVQVQGDALIETGLGDDVVWDFFDDAGIKISGAGIFDGGPGTDILDLIIDMDDPALLEITDFELFEVPVLP